MARLPAPIRPWSPVVSRFSSAGTLEHQSLLPSTRPLESPSYKTWPSSATDDAQTSPSPFHRRTLFAAYIATIMLSTTLLSLLLLAANDFVRACNTHVTKPPQLWLADLRNGDVETDTTLNRGGPGMRLIRFEDAGVPIPMTESETIELQKSGLRYFDVTETDLEVAFAERIANRMDAVASQTFPTAPSHQDEVNAVIATLSEDNLGSDLAELTKFKTRYYKSTTGATAAKNLATKLQGIASSATGNAATIKSISHTWGMSSTIARIEGTNTTAPVTIVGAHLDSINQKDPTGGVAPGADDNGSGCVNLIEAFRKLVASGFKPSSPVEFHWYSGEEAGLLGSAAVAASYSKTGVPIKAYLNLDMTAWLQSGTTPQVGFVSDRTNTDLTSFTKKLVPEYLSGLIASDDFCGYACSDHASWNSLGYPAVYPFESITEYENPNMHTVEDASTPPEFSLTHAHEFTKLVVAFLMELAL